MSDETNLDKTDNTESGFANHERPPFQRPLIGSVGTWLVRIALLGAVFSAGFVVGADNPDASRLLKELENDMKGELPATLRADLNDGTTSGSSHQEGVPKTCLNPPGSKPVVGLAGIHVDGPVGFDLSGRLGKVPVRTLVQMGVSFSYLLASHGVSGHAKGFATTWDQLGKCGVMRGVLHEFRANQRSDKQSKNFIAQVDNKWGELPPVVDVERALGSEKHRCEKVLPNLLTFIEEVEKASGKTVMIRTSPTFWNKRFNCAKDQAANGEAKLGERPLWIVDPGSKEPTVPKLWKNWSLWQASKNGRLGGDNRVPVDRFNGTEAQLRAWARGAK
jgi:GH25 family lysozyme M1 (1,4-beta-N-acetylmuramidase)